MKKVTFTATQNVAVLKITPNSVWCRTLKPMSVCQYFKTLLWTCQSFTDEMYRPGYKRFKNKLQTSKLFGFVLLHIFVTFTFKHTFCFAIWRYSCTEIIHLKINLKWVELSVSCTKWHKTVSFRDFIFSPTLS